MEKQPQKPPSEKEKGVQDKQVKSVNETPNSFLETATTH
jgi:hypothetical protein